MKKIRNYHAGLALGTVLILSGLVLSLLGYNAGFLTVGGVVGLGVTLIKRWRLGDQLEKDERTSKIRAFSLAYSWMAGLLLTTVIFSAINLGTIALDALTALAATIFIMTGSAIFFLFILQRHGDVQ